MLFPVLWWNDGYVPPPHLPSGSMATWSHGESTEGRLRLAVPDQNLSVFEIKSVVDNVAIAILG